MAKKGVAVQFDTRRKLVFRQQDLRDVVTATKRTVGDLFDDPFAGWPYLIQYGLRLQDNRITLNQASEFMDNWVDMPDPETKEERTLDQLRDVLLEALSASGFVKITKFVPEEGRTVGAEGNE
jgi:hypothetical protein